MYLFLGDLAVFYLNFHSFCSLFPEDRQTEEHCNEVALSGQFPPASTLITRWPANIVKHRKNNPHRIRYCNHWSIKELYPQKTEVDPRRFAFPSTSPAYPYLIQYAPPLTINGVNRIIRLMRLTFRPFRRPRLGHAIAEGETERANVNSDPPIREQVKVQYVVVNLIF